MRLLNNMTTQDEQWTENKEKIDDTDYGCPTDEDETGEEHGKGTYDCLEEEPDQEPEAVEDENYNEELE